MHPLTFYKCLADATRLNILQLLSSRGELCVCELTAALDSIQPKISRHLALLKRHHIIQDSRRGQWIYYRLHDDLPAWCREVLTLTLDSTPSPLLKLTNTRLGNSYCE